MHQHPLIMILSLKKYDKSYNADYVGDKYDLFYFITFVFIFIFCKGNWGYYKYFIKTKNKG